MSILEDSSAYEIFLERGEKRGLEKGRLEEARILILRVGSKRFGPPSEAAAATVNSLQDLSRLEYLLERVFDVADWDEVLATP